MSVYTQGSSFLGLKYNVLIAYPGDDARQIEHPPPTQLGAGMRKDLHYLLYDGRNDFLSNGGYNAVWGASHTVVQEVKVIDNVLSYGQYQSQQLLCAQLLMR